MPLPRRIRRVKARRGPIHWPPFLTPGTRRGTFTLPTVNAAERRLQDQQATLEYLRGVGEDLRYWYRAAEAKAQLVLTFNGLFLTFLTASVLAGHGQVSLTTAAFGAETWVFLAAMSLCLALAILCAVACLASRGLSRRKLQEMLGRYRVDPERDETYAPELTAFFYFLSALKPDRLSERMLTADQDFIVRALASDIVEFSRYILIKHRWVNRAFILTGLTLGFFLCTGIDYLLRVHLAAVPIAH